VLNVWVPNGLATQHQNGQLSESWYVVQRIVKVLFDVCEARFGFGIATLLQKADIDVQIDKELGSSGAMQSEARARSTWESAGVTKALLEEVHLSAVVANLIVFVIEKQPCQDCHTNTTAESFGEFLFTTLCACRQCSTLYIKLVLQRARWHQPMLLPAVMHMSGLLSTTCKMYLMMFKSLCMQQPTLAKKKKSWLALQVRVC
jgi:hypothetical protein